MRAMGRRLAAATLLVVAVSVGGPVTAATPDRNAYFGDTHIHTMYSFDAFMANSRLTPDDAYRYAKGGAIDHPAGMKLRITGPPLDFLMVSDHAKYLGVLAAQLDRDSPVYGAADVAELVRPGTPLDGIVARLRALEAEQPEFMGPAVTEYAWAKIIDAAERHNDPGTFTTFIGYEYTPTPGNRHLHRNVVFRSDNVPKRPFSSGDSMDPEDLWNWLDGLRARGIEALAIPHNMNQSDGLAFQEVTFKGAPIDRAFAEKRMRNEPIAEISQQKGTSETHPSLSPNDEWADFQIVQYYLNRTENTNPISVFKGGYYRDALNTGLEFQARQGFNPYQMGVIGASDSHVAAGPYEEDNYFSGGSNTAVARGSAYPNYKDKDTSWEGFWTPRQATHGTGGLAGVWAEENTRDSLFAAMRRRETFATSGPRIRVRFFGGDLPETIAESDDPVAVGYRRGVAMGGMLKAPSHQPPRFLVWAFRDPNGGWLQRAQIIKGWIEDGKAREAVFDVACSDGLAPDPTTHRCPDNGARVNLSDCSISRDKGAVALRTVWTDPDFRPKEQAYYYVRVLENPSCRWSTWDAIRLGIEPNPDLPAVHQERAWSSPIWYVP
jgi:hypothetical protein